MGYIWRRSTSKRTSLSLMSSAMAKKQARASMVGSTWARLQRCPKTWSISLRVLLRHWDDEAEKDQRLWFSFGRWNWLESKAMVSEKVEWSGWPWIWEWALEERECEGLSEVTMIFERVSYGGWDLKHEVILGEISRAKSTFQVYLKRPHG